MRRILVSIAFILLTASVLAGVSVSKRYRSERNKEREVRKSTEFIVLHTTEAAEKSSLRHVSERGLCHYCVTASGDIYQIIDRHRVAFHAGCSMWNKKEEIDNYSIGIECVGYHDKVMPRKQLNAIRDLVAELQSIYGIPDDKVLTHSQVAFGEKNKWQKHRHRGRKRCGMLFAMPSVRGVLKLDSRAAYDPDVKAKRLVVADKYLNSVLYGSVDTMVKTYGKSTIKKVDPIKSKLQKPVANIQKKGIKGEINSRPATVKFKIIPQTITELNAQGFKVVGTVTKKNLPLNIVGKHWNDKDTYYVIRGRVMPGNIIDPKRFEEGMTIWRKSK